MCKWVQLLFHQNSQYDKTIYKKNDRFLTHKSIHIWNVLVKSFPTMCRMMRNVTYKRSYTWMVFPKKTSERLISPERKVKKFREIVFFEVHLKWNHLVYIKIESKKYFLLILMRQWVQVFFHENSEYDKTIYKKIDIILSHKSIYIWNVLLKSFPAMFRLMGNVSYNGS